MSNFYEIILAGEEATGTVLVNLDHVAAVEPQAEFVVLHLVSGASYRVDPSSVNTAFKVADTNFYTIQRDEPVPFESIEDDEVGDLT